MAQMGVTAPVVRLCRHSNAEIQAEATDVLKVLARNNKAATIIVECGVCLSFHNPALLPHLSLNQCSSYEMGLGSLSTRRFFTRALFAFDSAVVTV